MHAPTSLLRAWLPSVATLALAPALWLAPAGAAAQLTLAHDTLARDTPTALTCGFCANEAIGVVFREIGTTAGLRASQFPVTLQSVQIALADATFTAAGCMTQMTGGTVSAVVEIWAGVTPPTATPPSTAALGEPWATDETLVWASDSVPITLSTPTTAGGTSFDLQLNSFTLQNEDGSPVVVPAPNTYLRVVVTLPTGGTSTMCDGLAMEGPGGFPLRDNDGVIASNRSFIHATGAGWFWNESVPGGAINGDWGIRLIVQPMGMGGTDGGPRDGGGSDAGGADGGEGLDASALADAGPSAPAPSGCACGIAGATRAGDARGAMLLGSLVALALGRRRALRAR